MVLAFNTFMLDGNNNSYTLTQSGSWKKQFLWHFGTTHYERANKIYVHDFSLGPARNY